MKILQRIKPLSLPKKFAFAMTVESTSWNLLKVPHLSYEHIGVFFKSKVGIIFFFS